MLSAIYMPTPPADSGVGTYSKLYPGKSGLEAYLQQSLFRKHQ
jgi:hypothetical protein